MLQAMNGAIQEMQAGNTGMMTGGNLAMTRTTLDNVSGRGLSGLSSGHTGNGGYCVGFPTSQYWPYQTVYWGSYPVYVCTDKTKKAIEVLKALQADKILKCDSVSRFISLVDKIAGLL